MGAEEIRKPIAAFVLSFVGGVISLILGFILTTVALGFLWWVSLYRWENFVLFCVIGPWILIAAIVVIVGSYMIYNHPEKHRNWGIIILVFSILGGGGIMGIVGGALAVAWSPTPTPAPAPITAITRICPKCGRVLKEDVKFCPYCGNELA